MKRLLQATASKWNVPRWRRRLQSYLERPAYVVGVFFIAALNSFIPFIPVEVFLILRVLVRPKEWWRNAVLASAASAVGMVCLSHLVQHQGNTGLASWPAHFLGQGSWQHVSEFSRQHGLVGLFFVSISFLPLPPAVVVCALSKVPDWEIAFSIGFGHCLKYGFFSWLGARFPKWFGDAEEDRASL